MQRVIAFWGGDVARSVPYMWVLTAGLAIAAATYADPPKAGLPKSDLPKADSPKARPVATSDESSKSSPPVPLIFDTDIGNDVDDVLALAMIHSLQTRGECKLLCVTLTKDSKLAAPFVDAINHFYKRGSIPIGICHSNITPSDGKFLGLATTMDDGQQRYPHDLLDNSQAEDAVTLLRRTLAAAEDNSVAVVQVGFSTNLANLLRSEPDAISPLGGRDLVKQKVKLLSLMAGAFTPIPGKDGIARPYKEYNVVTDIASAQQVASDWPGPIFWSGYEIGTALPYPHRSIAKDYRYTRHHPVPESYELYSPPSHDRPTWDLTSVLYAVRPHRGYFNISQAGRVTVESDGRTIFTTDPSAHQHYLELSPSQRDRVLEVLVHLSSDPPNCDPDNPTGEKP